MRLNVLHFGLGNCTLISTRYARQQTHPQSAAFGVSQTRGGKMLFRVGARKCVFSVSSCRSPSSSPSPGVCSSSRTTRSTWTPPAQPAAVHRLQFRHLQRPAPAGLFDVSRFTTDQRILGYCGRAPFGGLSAPPGYERSGCLRREGRPLRHHLLSAGLCRGHRHGYLVVPVSRRQVGGVCSWSTLVRCQENTQFFDAPGYHLCRRVGSHEYPSRFWHARAIGLCGGRDLRCTGRCPALVLRRPRAL